MKSFLIFSILLIFGTTLFSQDKPAYRIFTSAGNPATYADILNRSAEANLIFFGELHNNPISHWLEYELTKDLYEQKHKQLTLGAEMFEADNQLIMNEYLNDLISEKKFESEMRNWPNYKTDYKPLVNYAHDHKINFIATNIPRRYASMVYKGGFESLEKLSKEAKKYIAPLPVKYNPAEKCYADMIAMSGGHGGNNLPKAQAVKDATMAHFILKNLEKDKIFIHYNGAYHSDNKQGIILYLKNQKQKSDIITISTVTQKNIDKLNKEEQGKADFIIVVPESMTSTH